MDAVKFIKESKRLCKAQESCGKCVAQIGVCCLTDICVEEHSAEKAVAVVEQWSKDHPVKTRQSEFLKLFPKATVRNHVLSLCPLFYCVNFIGTGFQECKGTNCDDCCRKYWLTEVIDND